MGLDVYLYRYDNFDETIKKEKEYDEYSNKAWDDTAASEEELNVIREKCDEFAKKLGLDKYGGDEKHKEIIEIDSKKYPDHYFKIGYFRSSYNGGGINRILKNLGLPTLQDIFCSENDGYYVHPDWKLVIKSIDEVIEKFKKLGAYRVHSVSHNMFSDEKVPTTEKEALDVFISELERHKERDILNNEDGYSNINGEFYLGKPLKVLGMVPGQYNLFGNRDCVYIITESDNEWYLNALEIVKETCEYVLAQDNPEQYYLHWSG